MRIHLLLCFGLFMLFFSCTEEKELADTIFINGNIYTVDEDNPNVEALAIKADRILFAGSEEEARAFQGEHTNVMDLEGKFVMPGFIEGHGHFSGLGSSLMNLNFLKSKSWDEIVKAVEEKAKTAKPGEWITGRGWHQEKWLEALDKQVLGYPYHDALSAVSPDNPVVLRHASGHSLFANAKAMELAGVSAETPSPKGGEIVRDSRGEAIGVFEERAMRTINAVYQEYLETLSAEEKYNRWLQGIELAEEECLKKGRNFFSGCRLLLIWKSITTLHWLRLVSWTFAYGLCCVILMKR